MTEWEIEFETDWRKGGICWLSSLCVSCSEFVQFTNKVQDGIVSIQQCSYV